jgi:dipeptidyl aminopeptidase/acylaminoacyl peptidase
LRIFSTRRDAPESSPLPLPDNAFIRGISPSGELAIKIGGTLSRVPLSGGAPREVLDGIGSADWAPDGSSFAVVRNVGGKTRLEYPTGRVLYETAGNIGWPRISPRGDLVAFLDYPITGDELGSSVAVVDREGKKRTLASGFTSSGGVVWSPDGREVWFTAAREGVAGALYAMSLSGKERVVLRTPVPMAILDVAADGSVLLDQHMPTMRIIGLAPGESRERDLSWLDYSFASDLSSDGRTLLFNESGDGAGKSYRLYLRRTDGSLPILLGEGSYGVLSSDGAWALSLVGKQQRQIVLLPTKSGESKPVPLDGVTPQYAWFLRDDRRLLVAGYEPGHGQRLYVKDLAGGRPRPIGPEGVRGFTFYGTKPISPDGEWIFVIGANGKISLYGVENRQVRLLPGANAGDRPLQWTADGRGVYVMERKGTVFSVFRMEVATGRRELWKEVVPPDTAGLFGIASFFIAADGRSYVYSYRRTLADLYLVSGLK